VIGGKSSSPTLIKTQVVPQIKQRMSQMIIFICDWRFAVSALYKAEKIESHKSPII
jgi:hypothetical protein